jgi:hypothetical protein
MLRGYGLPVMASNAVADQASMMIPLLGLGRPGRDDHDNEGLEEGVMVALTVPDTLVDERPPRPHIVAGRASS